MIIMSQIFERFVTETPVSVMARAAMENALAPGALDDLVVERAEKQEKRGLAKRADNARTRPEVLLNLSQPEYVDRAH